jgi:glycosyltransferase involved in cell wall biosynthesis
VFVPQRIALIIPTLDQSGAEKQFTLLATHLSKADFSCRVLALTRGGPYEKILQEHGIEVRVLNKRWKFDPWAYSRLRRELIEFDPDIVHTWLFAANTYGRLAARTVPRAKVVVSERCVDSWKAGWQTFLDQRLIARTDQLIGNSRSVVAFYRQLGIPESKLGCIPNGIELPVIKPVSLASKESWRSAQGIPKESFVVGYVGRLAPQKAIQDLIWAVETLRQIRPQCHLYIAGDGPERGRLERLVHAVHADAHVHFAGHVNKTVEIYRHIDAFCLPSRFEGMSNSLLEAMAWEVPCLASAIPANAELIENARSGLLFNAGDAVGLMQGLRRFIDEPELRHQLGQQARQRVSSEFTIPQMVDRWESVYRSLTAVNG